MRTTLDLDDRLIESLVARHPGVPRTEAIERALRTYLETDSAERLIALAGSFDIEDVSAELRRIDRTS
jgi:metal-responsive CopG/Arc/MetJ family transcriptional regulator